MKAPKMRQHPRGKATKPNGGNHDQEKCNRKRWKSSNRNNRQDHGLKNIYEHLAVFHIIAKDDGDTQRGLIAKSLIIQSGIEDVLRCLKSEISEILPAIDQLNRPYQSPIDYEQMKAKGFFDDESYLEGGAA